MDGSHPGFHMPAVGGPSAPLLNQPPQIFGAFQDHALQLPQLPPELTSQMFMDTSSFLDDANDAKRRRIARACDMCRKKKIKCDGRLPACSHCTNYKTECVFTHVEKKRTPPKGAKYIEGLENRLVRMENLLRLSGVLGENDSATDLAALEKKLAERQQAGQAASHTASTSASPSFAASTQDDTDSLSNTPLTSPEPPRDREGDGERQQHAPAKRVGGEEEVEALSEMMCSLVTNTQGETRYLGSSSGFSILSPRGIQWVNEKTGDDSFQQVISNVSIDDHKWSSWKPQVFGDLFRRQIYRALPDKAESLSLLRDYFENFNCMFPLFHQPTFMHLVERQYSKDPYQGSGWWASLNIVLAIAHRLRVMSNMVPQDEEERAWGYAKNALAVVPELTMRNADLLSVQALLGIGLFMQGSPNPQPSFFLIAAAIRLSHSIGLHKRGTGFNLNPAEIEQRKRVFWIAYMLDKDLCLRSGRPPVQDDDDMSVELPDANPPDNIGDIPLADGKGKMNIFRAMCELATIEHKVYKRLYSTKAARQSAGELLNAIGELDQELETWKDKIPIDFRPEHEIRASHSPLIIHVVMLHLTYYNCLTTVHRMSIHRGYWTSRLSDYAIQGLNVKPLNPRVFSSAALSTSAARASIALLKYIPQGDFSCVWLILYFPISALVTLFGNILQNPLDPRAKSDARLMNLVVNFLSMLGQEAENGGVQRMLGICSEFERIAKVVIEKADKENAARRKRKSHDHPPSAVSEVSTEAAATRVPSTTPTPMTPRPSVSSPSRTARPASADSPTPQPRESGPRRHRERQPPQSAYNPTAAYVSQTSPPAMASAASQDDILSADRMNSDGAGFPDFAEFTGFGAIGDGNPLVGDLYGLQSPFSDDANMFGQLDAPDVFTIPMALDWDWAEISGGAYPSVENGNFGDIVPDGLSRTCPRGNEGGRE